MCRPDAGESAAVEVGGGGGGGAPRLRLRLALVLAVTIAASSALLFGHAIYPSSPLLSPALAAGANGTCTSYGGRLQRQRWKLSAATTAFAAATTLRLTVAAPLMRVRDKFLPVRALSSAIDHVNSMASNLEMSSHEAWEDAATRANVWGDGESSYREPPELDLEMLVPCEKGAARTYLMTNGDNPHGNSSEEGTPSCKLRDVITRELLVEYFQRFHDEEFDLATHPVLLRNVWPPESFDEDNKSGSTGGSRRRLTPDAILSDPRLAKLVLPNYFSDATKSGYDALVPDEDAITLSQFLRGIQSRATPHAKIGTQVIVEQYPELRDEIVPTRLARELFGWSTLVDDWKGYLMRRMGCLGSWLKKIPILPALFDRATRTSYYPIFIAGTSDDASTAHPRTDLHAEPIGNVASQLHGTRHWTLVPAKWSGLLRPTASRNRGYVYSDLDPLSELPERLDRLPRVYRYVTRRGDAVWIPPWMWHRVDYLAPQPDANAATPEDEQSLSIGASVFHFYPRQYIANFPLFGLLIVPNLLMEVLGFNVE